MASRSRKPLLERFEQFLPLVLRDDECWEWQGCRDRAGYGAIGRGGACGSPLKAHRVAWEAHNAEPIPHGLHVCHHCDNPACVNPAHLFVGTNNDNIADRLAKGRGGRKLTPARVREIRLLLAAGGITHRTISNRYGVSLATVKAIAQRRIWAHLD